MFGDKEDFDGVHGISAYNKTEQEKYEDSDSTFISPKFVQTVENKPISEWIISVGKHEGFISSDNWIMAQCILDDITEKYNRPHRKTNALLAGLVHCPHCGRRLSVVSESDRWTNGKPRFKYVCPGYRKKECNFKAVDGVLLDEFVVKQLSNLSDETSEHFKEILSIKIEDVIAKSQSTQEYAMLRRKQEQIENNINNQVQNLREVDADIKPYIQEDIRKLSAELKDIESALEKLDVNRKNSMITIRDLEQTKERLLSFAKYAEGAQPEVLVSLIQSVVEKIYIVDKDDERFCHIFIKGCSGEDYSEFFLAIGYISTDIIPENDDMCDLDKDSIIFYFYIIRKIFYKKLLK